MGLTWLNLVDGMLDDFQDNEVTQYRHYYRSYQIDSCESISLDSSKLSANNSRQSSISGASGTRNSRSYGSDDAGFTLIGHRKSPLYKVRSALDCVDEQANAVAHRPRSEKHFRISSNVRRTHRACPLANFMHQAQNNEKYQSRMNISVIICS